MSTQIRVLILEDRAADAELMLHELRQAGFEPDWQRVETEPDYLAALETNPDLILADWLLPHFSGLRALQLMNERDLDIPFIIVSGIIGEETAVDALRQGADDYVLKDRPARLGQAVGRALEDKQLRTERKQAEEELRESEEKYRTILENIEEGYFEVDIAGNFTFFNESVCRLLGYSREEMMGMNSRYYTDKTNAQKLYRTFNEVYRTGVPAQGSEWELIRKDNTKRYVECSVSSITNKSGQPIGFRGIIRDITERKQAEEELRKSEERFKLIFEYAPDAIYMSDLKGYFIAGNKAAEKITGFEREELIGGSFLKLNLLSLDQLPKAVTLLAKNALGKPTGPDEFILKKKGGDTVLVEITTHPIEFEKRTVVLGIARDITERKRAEEEIKMSENKFRAIFEGAGDGILAINGKNKKIEFANPKFCEITGYSENELFKLGMEDIHSKKDLSYVIDQMDQQLQRKIGVAQDIPVLKKDGTIVYCDITGRPVIIKDQELLVGFFRDITERKQAEEQIQRQVETLGALYDISRTLSESDDFNAILDLLTRRAVEAIHVTFARVLLLENGDLVARSIFPVRELDQDLQVGQREPLAAHPTCQRILEENTPRVLQLDSPEAGECAPFFLGIAQTLCIVPLHVREQPFGLLMLGEARAAAREPFTVEKLNLARNIGDQAASTLHRALLHEETERRLQRITALRTIDSTIAASMDLRITLSVLLEHVLTQLKVDAASVLLLKPHMQTLEYAAGRGFRTEGLQRTNLRLGEGYAGRAALERKLIYIPDLRGRKTDFLRSPYFSAEGFVAYYGVPLIAKGQVKGVLEVFHRAPLTSETDWVSFMETLAGQAAIAIDNTQLFDNLQRSIADLSVAYDATIEGWSAALDLRDKETEGHSLRVTEMTMQLARSLGIGDVELVHVRRGALLHDIGKMGVPDSILLKPEKLTDEEWVLMRKHPQLAFDMLAPITYLKPALDIPYCHHEKWDGTGYPRGMKGEEIPLSARIFAVVDVYDALISDRPYRRAWTREKTISHIGEQAGCHFDPEVVKVFLKELANEK